MSTYTRKDLRLLSEALATQLKVLNSRPAQSSQDEIRIQQFEDLKDRVDAKLLEE